MGASLQSKRQHASLQNKRQHASLQNKRQHASLQSKRQHVLLQNKRQHASLQNKRQHVPLLRIQSLSSGSVGYKHWSTWASHTTLLTQHEAPAIENPECISPVPNPAIPGWDDTWNSSVMDLEAMGFTDTDANKKLLAANNGDVESTISELLK